MLKKRTMILKDANMINEEVKDFVFYCIDVLEQDIEDFKSDKAEMLVTHVAMAIQRVSNKEPVNELDEFIWTEILNEDCFENAETLYNKISKKCFIEIPESEKKFIIMHICNILQ